MTADSIKKLIKSGIKDSEIEIIDSKGTGDHFSAVVISNQFEGKTLVERHQMVYKSVSEILTKELHALQLKTYSFQEWQKK